MPSLSDTRQHMESVQKTRKITNAMYLISSSRMRKAMRNIEQNRAYFYRAFATMREIRAQTNLQHPYLTHRTGINSNKTAFIVIAGERGLSGSYNHDILRLADESFEKHLPTHIFTVGDVATAHFRRNGRNVDEHFAHIAQAPSINTARRITRIIMDLYNSEDIDELRLVYTRFVSAANQQPTDIELLPIEFEAPDANTPGMQLAHKAGVIYDPSPEEVFHELVPQFIIGYIYGALVHAYASENVARMNAMENATKNADEMLDKLTREYHTARQVAITNELSEIVGAASAFGQGG